MIWSSTKWSAWKRCERMFYYQHIKRYPPEISFDYKKTFFGVSIDLGLTNFYKSGNFKRENLEKCIVDAFATECNNAKYKLNKLEIQKFHDDGMGLIDNIRSIIKDNRLMAHNVYPSGEFKVSQMNLDIVGKWDLVLVNDNDVIIVDWKCYSDPRWVDWDQLYIYAGGFLSSHSEFAERKVKVGFALLKQNQFLTQDYYPERFFDVVWGMSEAMSVVASGNVSTAIRKTYCKFCPYPSRCKSEGTNGAVEEISL